MDSERKEDAGRSRNDFWIRKRRDTRESEEFGKEEEEDDGTHEIMLDLGNAAKDKVAIAKEEGEVLMTIETPPSDTAATISASGQQGEKNLLLKWRQWKMKKYHSPEIEPYNPCLDLENYHYPTIDLMKHYDNAEPTIDMAEQNANKDKIINTLRSFGIEISTIKATVESTVTL